MKTKQLSRIAVVLLFALYAYGANAQMRMLSGYINGSYHSMAKDIKKTCGNLITVDTIQDKVTVENDYGEVIDQRDTIIIETSEAQFIALSPSGGSVDNFRKLIDVNKGIDVTFMQYDVLLWEQLKLMKQRVNKVDSLRILMPLGYEEIHLVTRNNSIIDRLKDLKNMQVAIGNIQQGTFVTANFIKEITGGRWFDVLYPTEKAFKALLKNQIDAFFFVGSAPVAKFEELASLLKYEIRLVPVQDERLDVYYQPTVIQGGTYKWEKEDVPTYAVKYALVCNITGETKRKRNMLYKLVSDIKENIGELQEKGHPAWQQVDFDFDAIDWPIHTVSIDVFELDE